MTGGIWEVYGRFPNYTSRLGTPLNKGIPEENGRYIVFFDVLGDSLYNVIHTESGQEPGLSHYYYEIIRADTTSEKTRAYYKKFCIEYHSHFDPDFVK